jgi:hypothetical protein
MDSDAGPQAAIHILFGGALDNLADSKILPFRILSMKESSYNPRFISHLYQRCSRFTHKPFLLIFPESYLSILSLSTQTVMDILDILDS